MIIVIIMIILIIIAIIIIKEISKKASLSLKPLSKPWHKLEKTSLICNSSRLVSIWKGKTE